MRTVGIIPARAGSTRFPDKPLAKICGVPMILHVAKRAAEALGMDNVYVATDSKKIAEVAKDYNVVMTGSQPTGTDRVAEAAKQIKADKYINIQGDEPLIDPQSILRIAEYGHFNPANAYSKITKEQALDRNIPKCVVCNGLLRYISRLPIPLDFRENPEYLGQVGLYAFRDVHLSWFQDWGMGKTIERFESIEILRFLEMGWDVEMVELPRTQAVDTPEDINKVEDIINGS